MKLTEEQIDFIETALIEKCNFKDFDDVRMELTDHIAIEIEAEMENNKLIFDAAFVKVMTRWNPMILPKSWSRYENVPYMVCKLWKSLDWKFQFSAIPLAALFSYIGFQLQEKDISIYLYLFLFLTVGIVSNSYLIYRKVKNKVNSTLSIYSLQKIYQKTFAMLAFLVMNIFFFTAGVEKSIIPVFWPTIYVSLLMMGKAWIMHKHLKIENQLLKVM